ncbi:MAG: acyl-CoA dehydrogenase family protein [Bacteroidota bacterium]
MHGTDQARTTRGEDCVARARSVTEVLRAAADRIESERRLPTDVLSSLHDARLFRLLLPRSLDGDELDPLHLAKVTEIIAAADASTAWCLGQAAGCAMSAAFLDPRIAHRIFGPREAVLAWGAGAQGRAIAVDGGYRITGTWTFASGLHNATWLGAHSKVFEADGRPRLRPDGRQLERTGLLPLDQAKVHDVWQVMGLCGTGSDSYEVSDLFLPEEYTFDREGTTDLRESGTVYKFPGSLVYAGAFGGVMLGIAKGTLTELAALAKTKTPRGAPSSLLESPVFQTQLAQLEARLRAARAYHHSTLARVWDEAERLPALTLDHRIDIRLAATHAINQGVEIVTEAYRVAGQTAIFDTNPFERRLRDALTASQQVQGRATHYTTVGRHLLGLAPDTMMFL